MTKDGSYKGGKPSQYKGKYAKKPNTWVNSRLQAQNKKLVKEMNAAMRSRGLIKARLTALTAKVSLIESELMDLRENLVGKPTSNTKVVKDRKAIQEKLLAAAELLAEEE